MKYSVAHFSLREVAWIPRLLATSIPGARFTQPLERSLHFRVRTEIKKSKEIGMTDFSDRDMFIRGTWSLKLCHFTQLCTLPGTGRCVLPTDGGGERERERGGERERERERQREGRNGHQPVFLPPLHKKSAIWEMTWVQRGFERRRKEKERKRSKLAKLCISRKRALSSSMKTSCRITPLFIHSFVILCWTPNSHRTT